MGATDSIADLLLSGRLRPAAQVAAEAPSRTSGAPRRAGVGGTVIGLFLRVAFGSDPQAVVLHLTVRPFRGPSQQRPIVPTPLRRCCTVVRTCSDLSPFSRPVMVSTLGTGEHRGSADLARLDVNRSLLHERRVLPDPAARAIRTLDGVISAPSDSLPPTDVHLSQQRPVAFTRTATAALTRRRA